MDKLRDLVGDERTRENAVHAAIENALWIFGYEFALISSDERLATVIESNFGKLDDGPDRDRRPDLLLLNRYKARYVLIEFKRPALPLDFDHKVQAERYYAKLERHAAPLHIFVLGGPRKSGVASEYENGRICMMTYTELISQADAQLRWLLGELTRDARSDRLPDGGL